MIGPELRNVKGFAWNHKWVCRSCRDLPLNLWIKSQQHLVRERPQPPAVSVAGNQVWSMDFIHDQLSDGYTFWLFNVLPDFSREAPSPLRLSLG